MNRWKEVAFFTFGIFWWPFYMWIGCKTPGFQAADCDCYKYQGYTICACDDDAVDHYCHKHGKTWDDGKPLDGRPIRGCARAAWGHRKARIWIGKSYLECLPHELAHIDGLSPAVAARNFPCLGEGTGGKK